MANSRGGSPAPWIAAGVAGAILCALVVVYFVVFRDDQRAADARRADIRNHVVGQLTATETAAMTAAATETANLLSLRRASFEADYQRALAGTTGQLKSDYTAKKQTTKDSLTQGTFDMSAKVTHTALGDTVTSGKSSGYVVLVTVQGSQSNTPKLLVQQTLAVTVLDVNGKWLAADLQNIGIDG